MKKLPPIEKIYEAWGAIADGRVIMTGDFSALVQSSDREKEYNVERLRLDREATELFRDINWNVLNRKYKWNCEAAVSSIIVECGLDREKVTEAAETVYAQLSELDIKVKRNFGRK